MILVTARNPSRKVTFVVTSLTTGPLASTPAVIIVMIVATRTLTNATGWSDKSKKVAQDTQIENSQMTDIQ